MMTISALEQELLKPLTIPQRINILNALAWELRRQNPARVMELATEAHRLASMNGDQSAIAYSLASQATVLHRRGQVEDAVSMAREAVTLAQAIGENVAYGRALWTLGWVAIHQGALPDALEMFMKAYTAASEPEHLPTKALALNGMGVVYGILENHPRAREAFEACLVIYEQLEDILPALSALNNLASLDQIIGNHASALALMERAILQSQAVGYLYGEYTAHIVRSKSYLQMGDYAAAAESLETAHGLVKGSDFASDEKTVLRMLSEAYLGLERYEDVETVLNQALALTDSTNEKPELIEIHKMLKALYKARGDFEGALNHAEISYALERDVLSEQSAIRLKEFEARFQTEQAQAEARYHKQLREQDKLHYQALMQMKDDLIAMTTHDIKSPLTVITSNVYLLSRMLPADPKITRYLNTIERQTTSISRLITDMLDLAYLESSRPIEKTATALSALVGEVAEGFTAACQQAGITLEYMPLREEIQMLLHSGHFERMLSNLISNAIKYTPSGGTIRITVAQQQEQLEISVADTGRGIPEKEQQRIFERFYRSTLDTDVQDGHSGLGLTIVKTIVEHHSGKIRVDSVLGQGTTFTMTFPLPVPEAEDYAQPA